MREAHECACEAFRGEGGILPKATTPLHGQEEVKVLVKELVKELQTMDPEDEVWILFLGCDLPGAVAEEVYGPDEYSPVVSISVHPDLSEFD